jgi:hypothetical protein
MCRQCLFGPPVMLILLALAGCEHQSIVGTWTGQDEQNRPVTYAFAPNGTGQRIVDGLREELTYELSIGYPNLIRLTVGSKAVTDVRQGLVQITRNDEMRLELGAPGGPAPRQLSPSALILRRPPTR